MTPIPNSIYVTFIVALTIALFAGCDCNGAEPAEPLPEGELVYDEDFSTGELGPEWKLGFYNDEQERDGVEIDDIWQIIDGTLHVQGAQNKGLWLQKPLPEQFRISFTARSEAVSGDIKFEVLGDGQANASGYVGIFGGWNNSLNIVARLDEHGDDRLEGASQHRVERGRDYRFDVVRTDQRLRWYVDGELFLSFDDPAPLRGDDHQYFAFNNWETPLFFDDLRIYDVSESQP